MRVLFTFVGGSGHFIPGVPLARLVASHGNKVAFSCQQGMLSSVRAAGFSAFDSGGATLADPATRGSLVPVDRDHEERVIRDHFAVGTARERASRLLEVIDQWRPDVLVRDEVDFGAAVAAERRGIPHASIVVLAAGGLIRPDLLAAPLNALRGDHGLPADPNLMMLHRYLTLVPVPPSYRDPQDRLPATAQHIQPAVLQHPAEAAQDEAATADSVAWIAHRPDRPTVYFTLGTIFHQESGDLFPRVLAGLHGLNANVVVTVGREIDPAELGHQPSNIRVERFIPQEALLPHCSAVVSHAGSGSVVGALTFGIPSVLLPLGADQPLNAARCAALGVARVLDPLTADAHDVRSAVTTVLHAPAYRLAAERLQNEIAQLPTVEFGAALIEALPGAVSPVFS